MNNTTKFVYVSGGKVQTGVADGHLSPSQVQRALLAQGKGCQKVLKTTYNHRNLVKIDF